MIQKQTLTPLHCNTLLYGSLFSGIGGFDLGFDRAGMRCAWQVELDPYCRKVLTKHWPDVPKHDDIRTFDAGKYERPDVLCGGFPCQDISRASNGRAGIDGSKSGLWWEFARVIGDIRPRFVVVENSAEVVAGWLHRIVGALVELGYDSEWKIHAACDAAAPHIRERCYIVAYPSSFGDRLQEKTVCSGWQSPKHSDWWNSEPGVVRVADGIPHRVDRLRTLGNAVVPQVAEWIGKRLIESV